MPDDALDWATRQRRDPAEDACRLGSRNDLIALLPKGSVGAEIGVQAGNLSAVLLDVAKPARLHLVDSWRHQDAGAYAADSANVDQAEQDRLHQSVWRRFAEEIAKGQVLVCRMFSSEAWAILPPLDWVYIDADHSYESVLADLRGAASVLRPSGMLMGHDYQRRSYFGVIPAVGEFLRETPASFAYLTGDRDPSFALLMPLASTSRPLT